MIKKCIVCKQKFEKKNAGKYCSKECLNAKLREKRQMKKMREEAKKANHHLYDKQFNPNIEKCLNCKSETCEGECERINKLIPG